MTHTIALLALGYLGGVISAGMAIVLLACTRIGAQADEEEQHSSYQEPRHYSRMWGPEP